VLIWRVFAGMTSLITTSVMLAALVFWPVTWYCGQRHPT
jgi:hypothetical protein